MQPSTVNNKRIAKNTMMLYIRMLLSVVVSLYTSRVVLEVLGVEDYGLYGLVGGVVAMFSFLNSTMAGATSRFLTFEMGRGDQERVKSTFSSALLIHIGIALIVLILSETVGLWYLNNKLVIPETRMYAAHWVLQFSVLSMVVSFTQVPYNAAIIAHEKMDVYAYVELLHVFLKLGIVYLLTIGKFDKLILYAFLVLVVNVIIAFIYRIYCIKHYEEAKFTFLFDKKISKEIVSFSLYNLLGNMGYVVNTQGTAFVINNFFGLIYNAASTVATTVSSVITGFSSNILTAFRPQVTMSYATRDLGRFQTLLLWALKSVVFVYALLAIPLGITINEILSIWLVEVPVYANVFCQLFLVNTLFETIRIVIIMGIHAVGDVRLVSVFAGVAFLLNPIIIFTLFSLNSELSPAWAFTTIIIINVLLTIFNILILKSKEDTISVRFFFSTLACTLFVVGITTYIVYQLYMRFPFNKVVCVFLVSVISALLLTLFAAVFLLDKQQRAKVLIFFLNKIKSLKYNEK